MTRLIYFILLIHFFLIPCVGMEAQNLVPNPSFEDHSSCPDGFGSGGNMYCNPWFNANSATCDYFNVCSGSWLCDVPLNYNGFQLPRTGDAYCGFWAKAFKPTNHYFEYLEAPLSTPLEAGKAYKVQFYVSLPGKFCAVSHIGAYFSVGPLIIPGWETLPVTPQVESNTGFLSDTLNWMLVEGCFIANGGESHIVIGNFHTFDDTPLDPFCSAQVDTQAYYFIDDVSVQLVQPQGLVFDLGDSVTVCYQYTIDPGLSGVQYYWEDGSTGPTLTVSTSGVYSLTVYDGCIGGVDSIKVNITNKPALVFQPHSYTICSGSSLIVSLDPSEGTYSWQDGSTSTYYTISTTGLYSVTLDDGCDLTFDTLNITVVTPPAPISLGNDTILCVGTEIDFNFDPELGQFTWQDGSANSDYIVFGGGTYALTVSNVCGQSIDSVKVDEIVPPMISLGPPSDVLCNGQVINYNLDPDLGTYLWQDGSTAFNYNIASSGIYSVTMSNACGQANDTISILALASPVFDLGDTIHECPGDTLILSADNVVGNFTWQDGSGNDSMTVTAAGVYGLTVGNICGTHTDSVNVIYDPLLMPPHLGPDINLCPGEQAIFYVYETYASFLWNDLSTADSLLISSAGIYYVNVDNGCNAFSDTVVVTSNTAPPVFNLPSDFALCQGVTFTLDPNIGAVAFLWNDGSTNPVLDISTPGTYALTVSNACGTDMDTIVISDGGPAPTVDLGMDISICSGATISLNPISTAVSSWLWQDGSANSSFMASTAGEYHVQVSNQCGVAYDTMVVDVKPAIPFLSLGADTSICSGTSFTLSINIPNVDILWSDGSSNPDLVISDSGLYYASIANSCGVSTDSLMIDLLPDIPSLDLGPDQTICPGEVITIDPNISNVNYLWQDGSSNSLFNVSQAGWVTLTINNICGSMTDSVLFTESLEGPDVDLGPDVAACAGESVTIHAGINGVNYLWQDGTTADSIVAVASGEYHLTVNNICGTDTDTILVDISGVAPVPDLGSDTTLCEGHTMLLLSDADAFTSATWQNGSSLLTFLVSSPGVYSVHESNRCGVGEDSILISYLNLPAPFDLGPDTILCPGEVLLLTAPASPYARQWQDGTSQLTMLATQSQTYSLQMSNECGVTMDSLRVSYDDTSIHFELDSFIAWCPEEKYTLDVTQPFPAVYLWNTGDNSPSIDVDRPGIYTVLVNTQCFADSASTYVEMITDCNPVVDVFVPNLFTPNGDGINEVFGVALPPGVEIISSEGSIFDRWGNLVYASKETPFIWNGKFKEEALPSGVFVYRIKMMLNKSGHHSEKVMVGDITLMR